MRTKRQSLTDTQETDADPEVSASPRRSSRPVVKLIGANGNAFNILGLCRRAARKAGWSEEKWAQVHNEMTAGDYDHLLGIAQEYFDVQ